MKKFTTRGFILIGMLSAVSYVLMLLNFPIPPFPSFLMVDFSDVPALIAAITLGPVAGILVELMKNVLDYVMTGSDTGIPIGHFANFMAGISFILPVYFVYNRIQSKKGMLTGLIAGTLFMAVLMSVLNYILILPAYKYFMNFELPSTIIVTGILPFNILKGILIAVVFTLLFTRMHVWLNKQFAFKRA
jgi:riboflavin transporter